MRRDSGAGRAVTSGASGQGALAVSGAIEIFARAREIDIQRAGDNRFGGGEKRGDVVDVGGGERRDHAGHNRVFALAALICQKLLARVFEMLAGENRIGFDLARPACAVASDARAVVFGFACGEIGGGFFLGARGGDGDNGHKRGQQRKSDSRRESRHNRAILHRPPRATKMKFPANWTFWRSAPTARALPRPSQLPTAQAAIFVGRSNAGKSSALNALVGARVARVAREPGRTRAANFFASGDSLLIDLPGYGYARAPKSDRVNWPALASACLRVPAARGLVVVVDIRRNVGAFDLDVLRLAAEAALPVLILLAKADKEGLGARLAAARQARKIIDETAAARAPPAVDIILFSARKKIGVAAAKKAVAAWLRRAPAAAQNQSPARAAAAVNSPARANTRQT